MFCDRCGMQMLAMQSTCGCGAVATRHWLQFVSLLTLMLAGGTNFFITLYVLPRFFAGVEHSAVVSAWLWTSEILSVYGWVLIAVALLIWAFWPHHGYTPETPVRVAQGLLILALLVGIANTVFPMISAGWAAGVNSFLSGYVGLILVLPWALVVLSLGGICVNAETRDFLLGTGKILSLVSLAVILTVITLSTLSWVSLETARSATGVEQESGAEAAASSGATKDAGQ